MAVVISTLLPWAVMSSLVGIYNSLASGYNAYYGTSGNAAVRTFASQYSLLQFFSLSSDIASASRASGGSGDDGGAGLFALLFFCGLAALALLIAGIYQYFKERKKPLLFAGLAFFAAIAVFSIVLVNMGVKGQYFESAFTGETVCLIAAAAGIIATFLAPAKA